MGSGGNFSKSSFLFENRDRIKDGISRAFGRRVNPHLARELPKRFAFMNVANVCPPTLGTS